MRVTKISKYVSKSFTIYRDLGRQAPVRVMKPLHIQPKPIQWKVLGINIYSALIWMFNKMPEEIRRSALSKTNAPKPGCQSRDMFDITGESPYEKEEVVPGKVWVVTYRHEDKGSTDKETKKQMTSFGMDPTSKSFQSSSLAAAELLGEEAVVACKRDLERAVRLFNKEIYTEEELKEVMTYKLRMFIVRLAGGSLLLYTPCRQAGIYLGLYQLLGCTVIISSEN